MADENQQAEQEVTPSPTVAKQAPAAPGTTDAVEPAVATPTASPTAQQAAQQAAVKEPTVEQQPVSASKPHQVEFKWKQEGDDVAPLTEMRAYLHSMKEAGIAVGAMQVVRQPNGKLEAGFGLDYDPTSPEVARLDGLLTGAKTIGGGLQITEPEGQQQARQQVVSARSEQQVATDTSQQTQQTFGRKNWDGLSAALTDVPSKMLSPAEQQQQQAGAKRIEQLAEQQGQQKEEVVKKGKSLLDIELGSNPISSFLNNFHAQLTGGAVTRTLHESDYDATRQALRQKLAQRVGDNGSGLDAAPVVGQTPAKAPSPEQVAKPAVAGPTQATSGQPFQASDLREPVLQVLGMTKEQLAQNGQLAKLLNGEKTDLLPLKATGPDGKLLEFEGRMQLKRDANGNAELQLSLPKQKLEIPQEVGGVKLSPEQQEQLKKTGQAGLVEGLNDPKSGHKFNGLVAVDPKLNRLVVLPAKAIQPTVEIAGVKLDKNQQQDLQQGKAVSLSNMRDAEQRSFNGTAQINAATARVEIRADKQGPGVVQQQATPKQEMKPEVKQEIKQEVKPEVKPVTPKVSRGPKR